MSEELRNSISAREKHMARYLFHRKNRELIAQFVRGVQQGQPKVLEIGCGTGNFSKAYLAPNCKEVIAPDILQAFVKDNIPNVKFIVANSSNLPFKDNSFDIVVSLEVIEHVPDDQRFIEEGLRVLKKGGVFYLTTPNRLRLTAIAQHLIGKPIRFPRLYGNDPVLGPMIHMREYSYKELVLLLKKVRISIASWEIKGIWLGVPAWQIGILEPPQALERLAFDWHAKIIK